MMRAAPPLEASQNAALALLLMVIAALPALLELLNSMRPPPLAVMLALSS
ncbi:MAG: hypothetical protein LBE75_03595 [Burkholderiales bacterium]|nr:hypothetical protein [Burkholderiales bacterium]